MPTGIQVAIVAVTFNSSRFVRRMLESVLLATEGISTQIVVVDNGSSDNTVEVLRQFERVEVIEAASNPGYAAGINIAVGNLDSCRSILVLNPDLVVDRHAVATMLSHLQDDPGAGIVTPRVLEANGDVASALRREPTLRGQFGDAVFGARIPSRSSWGEIVYDREEYERTHEIDWATGAAMLISEDCWRDLGNWDEQFFLYSEETDFFRRARDRGWHPIYCADAMVVHEGGGSGSSARLDTLMLISRVRYARKHGGLARAFGTWLILVLNVLLRLGRAGGPQKLRILSRPWGWESFVRRLRTSALAPIAISKSDVR